MAIEQHNKTGTIIENRQMSRLQGRVRGAYIITEMLISVCPSTQLYHITYWGCMTYWGCKPYWGSRTYTSFQSDIMHCAKVCEKRIVPISQKVLELCHALISQSRDPESLLKIMKAIELLSHSDHLLLRWCAFLFHKVNLHAGPILVAGAWLVEDSQQQYQL